MYILVFIVVTLIVPIASILSEYVSGTATPLTMLIGKWIVFWGVGVRLLTVGMSQILRPQMSDSGILGIEGEGAEKIVRVAGANWGTGVRQKTASSASLRPAIWTGET